MKKSQQYVLIIGLILFLLLSVFPPVQGIYNSKEITKRIDMGYYFIFDRPAQKDVYHKIFVDIDQHPSIRKPSEITIDVESKRCYAVIDYKLYLFEYFVLLNIALVLFVLFRYRD